MKALLLLVALVVVGCGDAETEQADRETVFDPLVENLDKAKEVEGQVLEHKQKMDDAIAKMEEDLEGSE